MPPMLRCRWHQTNKQTRPQSSVSFFRSFVTERRGLMLLLNNSSLISTSSAVVRSFVRMLLPASLQQQLWIELQSSTKRRKRPSPARPCPALPCPAQMAIANAITKYTNNKLARLKQFLNSATSPIVLCAISARPFSF